MQTVTNDPETLFNYKARDTNGSRKSGQISGRDRAEATAALKAKGLFPISLEADDGSVSFGKAATQMGKSGQLSAKQTADFLARLAKLAGRQIPIERSLAIIGEGGSDKISTMAQAIRKTLREGTPLSRALQIEAGINDPVTLSLISGAEVSGDMDQALSTAADILQNRLLVRRRIVTGLMYPGILLFVALISLGLIMIAIIPQFRPLVADRFDLVPPIGRAVFAFSHLLTTIWPIMLVALVAAVFLTWFAARRGMLGVLMTRVGSYVPFISQMVLRNQMMLMLHVLGALLARDVTLSGALRVVTKSSPEGVVKSGMAKVTRTVESGDALSSALREQGLLPREAIEMIRIGEEAGDLGGMISRTSLDMREAADRDLERFLLVFQPALIVGVGLLIGVSLYALFSAIVAVNAISF